MKDNVYINADPADLSALEKFIADHGPFDVVIDGLNVSYHDNNTSDSPHVMVSARCATIGIISVRGSIYSSVHPSVTLLLKSCGWPSGLPSQIFEIHLFLWVSSLREYN